MDFPKFYLQDNTLGYTGSLATLLVSMYLYIFTAVLCRHYAGPLAYELPLLGLIYSGFVVGIFIPNMIYAFVMARHGVKSSMLLFWDMVLKLFQIPIYALVFLVGVGLSIHGIGIILMPILITFDYLLLLSTSMYGVSGLIQARREGKITAKAAIVNGILHFIFCTDVISATMMFIMVKKRDKKLLNETQIIRVSS